MALDTLPDTRALIDIRYKEDGLVILRRWMTLAFLLLTVALAGAPALTQAESAGVESIDFGLCTKQETSLEGVFTTIPSYCSLSEDGLRFIALSADAHTVSSQWLPFDTPVVFEAGQQRYTGIVSGPGSLVKPECSLDFHSETTHLYWHLLRPGLYATPAMIIHVYSANDVVIEFSEFEHAVYVADRTKPALRLAYSIGDTIADAEAFGWRDAGHPVPDGFNGTQILIPAAEMAGGEKEVIIWARAYLTEDNSSSQYEAGGNVSVKSVCP
jgi:hypothetical protein